MKQQTIKRVKQWLVDNVPKDSDLGLINTYFCLNVETIAKELNLPFSEIYYALFKLREDGEIIFSSVQIVNLHIKNNVMQYPPDHIEVICLNCNSPNWLPSGATGDNCENCGHLFESKYTCPLCSGNGWEYDDNEPTGSKTCSLCDGKAYLNFDEVEEYETHDPNLM